MCKYISLFVLLLFASVLPARAESYQVVFETVNCDGSTGFATVGVETIYKIEESDCSDPDHPGQKLKQLLVHDNSGSYRAYTLAQEEASNVMQELKSYMKARRGLLERADAVIVKP